MRNLAIIPARGGSKRIPRKNIKSFFGKPIIAYSIEIAKKSNLFDDIIVSTDDKEIARIGKEYGASVPFMRSKINSNHYATLSDVIEEVKLSDSIIELNYQYICCILPTSPFITIKNLNNALDLLIENNFDSVRPVVEFAYPIYRSFKLINNKVVMNFPENSKTRSQDLDNAYHDACQFYWIDGRKKLSDLNKGAIVIDSFFNQDIDTNSDWVQAEYKYQIFLEKNHNN